MWSDFCVNCNAPPEPIDEMRRYACTALTRARHFLKYTPCGVVSPRVQRIFERVRRRRRFFVLIGEVDQLKRIS